MANFLEQKILHGLNKQQLKATKFDKPHQSLMLLAGAGSGKTKTIVSHVAWLIVHDHVNPFNIVMLTFTTKASKEMMKRLRQLLGARSKGVWASTFHSFCLNAILRPNAKYLGYTRSFTICGDSSQRTLVKHIMIKLNIDTKQYDPRTVLNRIAGIEANVITPKQFTAKVESKPNPFLHVVSRVYRNYIAQLRNNNEMDFNELIFLSVLLLQRHPDICEKCEDQFQYINVDEVQDNSLTQWKLLRLLSKKYNNLFSCGDDSQSIYSFRFARPDILINFSSHFPHMHLIKMTRNYRSTKRILSIANHVISNNKMQIKKNMYTNNELGQKAFYYRAENAHDEADYIIHAIKYDIAHYHYNYNDFTILYRQNAQSRVLEEEFVKAHIPHVIYNGTSFFQRKEILDTVAYLQALVNKRDNLALSRIINVPKRGIGQASVTKMITYGIEHHCSLLKTMENVDYVTSLGTRAKNKIKKFTKILTHLQSLAHRVSVTEITKKILVESGYLPKLIAKSSRSAQARKRIQNIKEFISYTQEYDQKYKNTKPVSTRLSDFLANVQLLSAQDTKTSNKPQVKMMTIHASKGLEFPVVFIVGCEENLLPSQHERYSKRGIEEERRLFYVATTRAENRLYLTNAFQRLVYGRPQQNPESRFIKEIPKSLIYSVNDAIERYNEQHNSL